MKSEKCFLFDGCKGRTASCYAFGPTDEGCPVYRHFRDLFQKKQQPEPPRFLPEGRFGCPDCGAVIGMGNPYCWSCGRAVMW